MNTILSQPGLQKGTPMKRAILSFLCVIAFVAMFAGIVQYNATHSLPREDGQIRGEREDGPTGAMAALDFWSRSRAYPNNDIPADKYYREYQSAKSKQKEISLSMNGMNTSPIWDPIGPTNLHGRSISVALNPSNPNTVYLGTASGGLWRSYTGGLGADWQQVKLGYPALGISAIVIDPTDSNTIYIGTGEVYRYGTALGGLIVRTTRGSYGIGILKSTNGGATWVKSLDWTYQQQSGIQALKMNPLNHNTIWAATTDGIAKSTDAGLSWDFIGPDAMAEDIVIYPPDTNRVLVTTGNFNPLSAIWRTNDGGLNWSPVYSHSYTGKTLLCAYAAHPNVVYASAADSVIGNGDLLRTTDFGDTWVVVHHHPSNDNLFQVQGWYSHFVVVHPTDSTQIVHAGVPVYKSTNGGSSFFGSGGIYSDNHGYAVNPVNPNILYVADDDGIYRSTDFGSSFTSVGTGLQTGQLYNGFSCSAQDSLLAVGQSQDHIPGYIYRGSPVWDRGATDEAGWTAINQSNDNIIYYDNRNGGSVCKSINRGVSNSSCFGFGGIGAWNSPFVLSPSNPTILYFADNRVFKSTNSGSSFSITNGGAALNAGDLALSMAIAPTNPDTVFVGMAPLSSSAQIFRTVNGGTTWTVVSGTLPNRYPMDLAIDPHDSRVVYAAYGGFGTGHLFKSTDAGANWADITGTLPDVPTNAIAIDPLHTNIIYVGNDIGVSVSTDGGSSWSGFSTGLPDAIIAADLVISPSNRALRVATHGNGVFERKLYGDFTDVFDYKAFALNSPADGSQSLIGSAISNISASFRNQGTLNPPDSFNVKYRILSGNTELYSSIKRIPGLAIAEVRQVTFDGSFSPPAAGSYTLQAICLAGDQVAGNDTLVGTTDIVMPPDLASATVRKSYCPYTEISGGSPGPGGDDVQLITRIPFVFRYDGVNYDSAQISTNGWVELGTGPRGSFRGLSTSGQLGGFFTQVLATTDRPTKVLGPWWADLYTASGNVSYTTQGSAPNRIFVVQWKSVVQCCDPGSTQLNFQVRLFETSNVVEFDYGAVVPGSFENSAAMGFKDYIGGDYRYYDLFRQSSGLMSELRTDLLPSTDWPGQDSCFRIQTNPVGVTANFDASWNMVSVPVELSDYSVASVFPQALNHRAFRYHDTYLVADSLNPGDGYWAKFALPDSQFIVGDSIQSVSIQLRKGWNMIGSVGHTIPAPTGGIISSALYGYSSGYQPSLTIQPGKAYWIKASADGPLNLGPDNSPRSAPEQFSACSSITISDKSGRHQTLYLREDPDGKTAPDRYQLPPLPPDGMFDARFASDRILEDYPAVLKEDATYSLKVQGAEYPLVISYDVKNGGGKSFDIQQMKNGIVTISTPISGNGKMTIASAGTSIRVNVSQGAAVPTHFSLSQNYPNPFNPVTRLSFDVPSKSIVSLTVFDILGRKVMTLAQGEYEAGTYSVSADFSGEASGIYLYRMTAGTFTQVKKLVVTK